MMLRVRFRSFVVSVATTACVVSTFATAQTPPTQGQPPGIKVFTEEKKSKLAGPKGPGFQLDTSRTRREAKAEELRDAAIQAALDVIDFDCGDNPTPDCPKTLIKLADEYWQKSEDYYFMGNDEKLMKALYDAEETNDKAELDRLHGIQGGLGEKQRHWQVQAINTYKQIEKEHPNFPDFDQVLYSLGYLLSRMGEKDQGYQYYATLVLQRPTSDLIPDTLLNIGDYFFETKADFQQALAFYEKVKQYGDTPVQGYAIYKSGWCWFNLGDKAKALNLFYETVQWTVAAEKRGQKAALDLRKEALGDMVRAYADIGAPNKAVAFFKKSAPDIYTQLCEILANIYTDDASFGSSSQVYQDLVNDVGDKDPRASKYMREMVYNTFKSGDKDNTRKSVIALSDRLKRVVGTFPADFKKAELGELEQLLKSIGTEYHKETEKTKDKATQLTAVQVYETYLEWFPEAKDNYPMNFNTAVLAYQMGEYERAAKLFEKVIEINSNGEYTGIAAYQSCVARYKIATKKDVAQKKENDPDGYKPATIPETEQALVTSCTRYVDLANKGTVDVKDMIPNALYAVAAIYFDYNHFDQAAPMFAQLYNEYHEQGKAFMADAAKMLLAIYNLQSDIDNLYKWTDIFSKDPVLSKGDFGKLLADILAKRDFNICRKMEFEKKYREGGDCFMKYATDFRTAKDAPDSLAKAALLYKDGRFIEPALAASERLYNDYPDSPIAPQALYNIGQIYQAIAVYSEAAHYYELYAQNHPDHDATLLARALARAATYRRALGEYDKAISDYTEFFKKFPKNADAGDIYFEIGLIYESQQNWKGAVKHFQSYLKQYAKTAPPGNVIAAHSKMGIAFWRSGQRKPALDEFAAALTIFNDLQTAAKAAGKQAEISEGGLDSVAAAKFYQGEVVLDELKKVELKLPEKVFTANLQKKLALISEATDRMQEVAQFERPHWEIAAFNRIGQAYQNLSEAIENAPVPKNLPEDIKFEVQEEFRKKAEEVRNKSVEAYRICLERARTKQWFNEFSDNCEQNVAKLDLEYKFTREIRPQPTFYRANANVPAFVETAGTKAVIAQAREIKDWLGDKDKVDALLKGFEDAATGEDVSAAIFNQALVELRRDRDDKALEILASLQSKDPRFAQAPGLAAEILQRNRKAGWEGFAEKAAASEKFQPEAMNARAAAALERKDWSAAMTAARTALIGNAENVNAYQNLARTYFEQGQYQMTRLVVEEALRISNNAAAMHNLLGLTYLRLDSVRSALASFRDAAEEDPTSVESHMNLASTVLNYADFEQAKKHFSAAITIERDNQDAILGRAVAERGLSEWDAARNDYESLFKAQPGNADLRYNKCLLLAVYEEKYEDALGVCQEFVAMAPPTHPKRAEIVKRIEGLKQTIEFMKQEDQEKKDSPPPAQGGDSAAPPAEGGDSGAAPAEGESK